MERYLLFRSQLRVLSLAITASLALGFSPQGATQQDSSLSEGVRARIVEAFHTRNRGELQESLAEFRLLVQEVGTLPKNAPEVDWRYFAGGHLGLSTSLLELGLWRESAEYLEGVLVQEPAKAFMHWSTLHATAAEAYIKGGLLDLAQPHVEESIRWVDLGLDEDSNINFNGYAEAHLVKAKFFLATAHPGPAIEVLENLIEWRTKDGAAIAPGSKATAWTILGTTHYQMHFDGGENSLEEARKAYGNALAMSSITNGDRFSCLTRLAHLELELGEVNAARPLLDSAEGLIASGKINNVYDRVWLASLMNRRIRESEGGGYSGFDASLGDLWSQWEEDARAGGTGFLRFGRIREVQNEAILGGLEARGASGAFDAALKFQHIGFLIDALQPKPATERDLAASLDEGEVCLLFAAGKTQIHGFALTANAPVTHWSVSDARNLLRDISSLSEQIWNPKDDVPPSLEILSGPIAGIKERLFPQNIQDLLGASQFIRVIGRNQVNYIPIEVIPIGGQTLGLTHAIADWPSAAVGLHIIASAKDQVLNGSMLVSTAPVISQEALAIETNLAPIPNENWMVDSTWSKVVEGDKAGFAAWQDLRDLSMLQIVSHGIRAEDEELGAGLVVSPDGSQADGIVTAYELWKDPDFHPPPLTFLGICKGQRGPLRDGDAGAASLSGVFLGKGAQTVIATRGDSKVFLGPTTLLQRRFTNALAGGERMDKALLLGRQTLAKDPKYSSPTHWAAWQVLGVGSRTVEWPDGAKAALASDRTFPWSWAVIIGAGLLVVALLTLRVVSSKQT